MSKMNLWTRYRFNCPSKQLFSFHDLNMKRKALTTPTQPKRLQRYQKTKV